MTGSSVVIKKIVTMPIPVKWYSYHTQETTHYKHTNTIWRTFSWACWFL